MKLTYIYHSGFILTGERLSIVIDYFNGLSNQSGSPLSLDTILHLPGELYVLSSHSHPDHFSPVVLSWKEERKDIHYIFSKDILKRKLAKAEDATYLKKGDIYNDENLRIQAFGSTDVGISFYIEACGKRIFHAGDLNNWHWIEESTEEEIREAEDNYLRELDAMAQSVDRLDLAMFPIDPRLGKDFDRGGRQFIDCIPVRIFVPMHFWERPAEVEVFRPYAESHGVDYEVLSVPGQSLDF